ncbi:MAG TPA: site-specific integrase [Solirubrobacteraceae bacterium]|nr:site-specific integrase [Solirubrobacteraceae bacterium]
MLDHYVAETWARTHAVTLAPKTAKTYAVVYDLHIGPYLGAFKLSDLTPEFIARWQADPDRRRRWPDVGAEVLSLLGAILQLALESERIARNPVRTVRKVARPPKKEVQPLPPATIEAMRAASGPRDATLISVLAYAGLRPGEALDVRWRHSGERTLTVYASKTRQRRSVRLLAPLAEDLRGWRRAAGDPEEGALVFPSAAGGRWSRRRTRPGRAGRREAVSARTARAPAPADPSAAPHWRLVPGVSQAGIDGDLETRFCPGGRRGSCDACPEEVSLRVA